MKRNYLIPAIAAAVLVFSGCKKDIDERDNTFPANTASNGAILNLFAQHAPPVQQFTISAATGGTVYGASGGRVTFVPNAFRYANNQPVTGNVTIHLQEVYTKRDIIFSGGYTTAHGLPLVSGGEMNITAWQGSQELKLAGPGYATARIPAAANAAPMRKFWAANIGPDADFRMTDSTTIGPTPDSSASSYSYGFGLDSLDWTNCDQYYSFVYSHNATMAEFYVPVPSIFNGQNSFVLITSPYSMSASRVWRYNSSAQRFECDYYRLPVGFDFTFTIVSEINGTFYYDSRTVTIADNITIALNPKITSEAQIIQNVGNL